jgi:hypothetical protein
MMATRIIVIPNDMVMSPGVAKQIPLQSQIAKSKDDGRLWPAIIDAFTFLRC